MKDKKTFIIGAAAGMLIAFSISILMVFSMVFVGGRLGVNGSDNSKIARIERLLDEKYVDPIDSDMLSRGMLKGLVASIGDPYTAYMDELEFKDFNEDTNSEFAGIGIFVSTNVDNDLVVISPIEGSPGYEAGILPGDIIVKVNGFEVNGGMMNEAINMMKGPKGTSVNVTLYRKSEERYLDIAIKRAMITLPTVSEKVLDHDIGYIRITHFAKNTYDEFKKAYDKMMDEKVKGLIIDLRNNPGGLLDVTIQIADLLVPEGTIVYTIDRDGNRDDSLSGKDCIDVPLAILVNEGSASASEVLSGAVKDHGTGKLIGTTTFGKGLVQQIFDLRDGTAVKITVQRYYTPSGVCIHGIGIEPDYVVEFSEEDLEAERDIQLEKAMDVVLNAGYSGTF